MAASGEKPYRVYRGGRTKGKVPVSSRDRDRSKPERSTYKRGGGGGLDGSGKQVVRRPRKGWTWKRWTWVTLVILVVFLVVWGVAGYFSVRTGVKEANQRLPVGVGSALAPQNALLLSTGTNILLLGTDHSTNGQAGRSSDQHSDSMLLLHTDPSRHRLVYLSIPRDLRASIPGYGEQKINAAMQIGGPALVVRTIEALTGNALHINHVMIVDFANFKDLIDNIGGIDITVPAPILSNKFDCPYDAAGCARWKGWRFAKGRQHMDGRRALIYSRIRENQLDPRDTDITRGGRQQAVLRAALHNLLGFGTFVKLPFDGKSLLKPLTTDLSAWQFVQLGWVLKRAGDGKALHCRLGGTSAGGDIIGSEDNRAVIAMVTGASAPQPPRPGEGLFAPGCVVGNQAFTP